MSEAGPTRRSGDGGTSTTERIADAAIAVIAREGFDALSVRRVATEASVTGGTVQHHYPTKVALTVAALDRTVRRQQERIGDIAHAPSAGPLERLLAELCELLPTDPASTEEAVVWIAMSAAVPGHPFVADRQRAASELTQRWISSQLRAAVDLGALADIDRREVAAMIEAALDGMLQQTVADPTLAHDRAAARLRTMVTCLLSGDAAPDEVRTATTRRGATRRDVR
jgi:AcrR family transcriptional regulator